MAKNKLTYQMIWGIVLVLAGVGVFFRIPQVMPTIESIEAFSSSFALLFIRFCFYFIGVLLIGGGSRKIYENARSLAERTSDVKRIDKMPVRTDGRRE